MEVVVVQYYPGRTEEHKDKTEDGPVSRPRVETYTS
jgi:hypothetical protein